MQIDNPFIRFSHEMQSKPKHNAFDLPIKATHESTPFDATFPSFTVLTGSVEIKWSKIVEMCRMSSDELIREIRRINSAMETQAQKNADRRRSGEVVVNTSYIKGKYTPTADRWSFKIDHHKAEMPDTYLTVEQRDALTDKLLGFRHYVLEGTSVNRPPQTINEKLDDIASQLQMIASSNSRFEIKLSKLESERRSPSEIELSIGREFDALRDRERALRKKEEDLEKRERQLAIKANELINFEAELQARKISVYESQYVHELISSFEMTTEKETNPCVYLLHAGGRFKIGYTNNLFNRLNQMRTGTPYPIEVVCLLMTNDPRGLEWQLHSRFADKRLHGEWFALTDDDVHYIQALAEAA